VHVTRVTGTGKANVQGRELRQYRVPYPRFLAPVTSLQRQQIGTAPAQTVHGPCHLRRVLRVRRPQRRQRELDAGRDAQQRVQIVSGLAQIPAHLTDPAVDIHQRRQIGAGDIEREPARSQRLGRVGVMPGIELLRLLQQPKLVGLRGSVHVEDSRPLRHLPLVPE